MEAVSDGSDEGVVVGDAGGGEDGVRGGVGACAEGCDGGGGGVLGVEGSACGGFGAVGRGVKLVGEYRLSVARRLIRDYIRQLHRFLHIPLLETALGREERHQSLRLIRSAREPQPRTARPSREAVRFRSVVLQIAKDYQGGQARPAFECQAFIRQGGTAFVTRFVPRTGRRERDAYS